MLDMKRLWLLSQLAEKGTVAAVAHEEGCTPSAISQQLAQLEKDVGVRLLFPMGRGVRLSSEAEVLVDKVRGAFEILADAETAIHAMTGHVGGILKVGVFETALHLVMPQVLKTLRASYPELNVVVTQIDADEAIPLVRSGDFSIIIGEEYEGLPLPISWLIDRKTLVREQMLLCLPQTGPYSLAAQKKPPTCLAECAHLPFVLEPEGKQARYWAQAMCRRAGFEPHVIMQAAELHTHLRMVKTGLAVALVPQFALLAFGDEGVDTISVGAHGWRSVFTATPKGLANQPSVVAFHKVLRHEFSQSVPILPRRY